MTYRVDHQSKPCFGTFRISLNASGTPIQRHTSLSLEFSHGSVPRSDTDTDIPPESHHRLNYVLATISKRSHKRHYIGYTCFMAHGWIKRELLSRDWLHLNRRETSCGISNIERALQHLSTSFSTYLFTNLTTCTSTKITKQDRYSFICKKDPYSWDHQ